MATTLHYVAPAQACPTATEFANRVRHHAPAIAVEIVAGPPYEVGVTIQRDNGTYGGRLEVVRAGRRFVRKINASSCDELTSVLAFVSGLTLAGNGPAESRGTSGAATSGDPGFLTVEPETDDTEDPSTGGWRFWTGARGLVTSATAPGWTAGENVFFDIHAPQVRKFASTVRIGFFHLEPRTDVVREWQVRTSTIAGRFEASPFRLRLAAATDLRIAVGVDVGSIAVYTQRASNGADSIDRSVIWLDEFFGLRLEVRPEPWLSLELQVELAVPITRHNFPLDGTLGFQVPPVAGTAAAGLAFRVW